MIRQHDSQLSESSNRAAEMARLLDAELFGCDEEEDRADVQSSTYVAPPPPPYAEVPPAIVALRCPFVRDSLLQVWREGLCCISPVGILEARLTREESLR